MKEILLDFAKALLPQIIKIIAEQQQAGVEITEAGVLAELTAQGLLQEAEVDDWLAAHPKPAPKIGPSGYSLPV
jgi:hypothetical protein